MAFFEPEDLYSIGQEGSDLAKGLATDIANNVCGLYQASPAKFGISNPAGNAVSALASGVWDSFCGRLPEPKIPSVPQLPFQGGQCEGVQYNCSGTVELRRPSNGSLIRTDPWSAPAFGRITGISIENPSPASPDSVAVVVRYVDASGNPAFSIGLGASREITDLSNLTIASIVRADGQPDNCGNLPVEYPPSSVPDVNPRTYNHPGNDGVERPINYNITFNPGFSPSIEFPDLPDLKIPVSIDATGIEVNIPAGIGNLDEKGALTDDDIEDLLEGAKAASRAARAGVRRGNEGDPKGEGDEGDGISNLYGLIFSATEIPPFFGKVFGNPVKYRLGRVSFKRDGIPFEDVDILFESQYIPAPVDANGYVATYETGVIASITVVTGEDE